ncbi:MAG TPA: serine/threonine-protein kinase [Gemmataceae bacterium]|nr:serine/threonine-protein kinase [Gemmataceae bacterium]
MQPGQKVGPFDIEKRIGSGAMGTVYRARYRKTGQLVAIKVISPGGGDSELAQARFEREAEVLKQLNHPNIVRFYIASQFQGVPYYAMEYIQGEPLDRALQRRDRLTWEETVEWGKQICAALQHAHDQGIVHRDLKPSNLMVTPDGNLKLTDFGIAKDLDVTQLTAANATVGTAAYMSPEQCRGEKNLSHKSDLYSLGVVLYELLTGRKPFKAETTIDMFLQHVQGSFERPARIAMEIPVWLDTIVCQLLEKKPEHRPYDAAMVSRALNQVAEKVAALQSAGVDVAKARFADRSPREGKPSKEDKADARKVLAGLRSSRRKLRKKKPLYEKGWFQAIGIVFVLSAVGAVVYQVLQPPSADKLFQRAAAMMSSSDLDGKDKARAGPITDYLRYYGNRTDSQSIQIHQWADSIDMDWKWQTLSKMSREGDEDEKKQARNALQKEGEGELNRARELWQSVAEAKQKPDGRAWGLLGERGLKDLDDAEEKEKKLRTERIKSRNFDSKLELPDGAEKLADKAMAYEDFEDFALACTCWRELRINHGKDLEYHPWTILAAKQLHELTPKLPKDDKEEVSGRRTLLDRKLKELTTLEQERPAVARSVYKEFIALYKNSSDPDVLKFVAQAKKALEKPPPKSDKEAPGQTGSQESRR